MPDEATHTNVADRIREIADQVSADRRAQRLQNRTTVTPGPQDDSALRSDPVNHPSHYTSHPSGIECIQITEWMNFNLGNAVKYIWRANEKGTTIQDLEKAQWYLAREVARLKGLL